MTIYLDHQASTPTYQSVVDVMQPLWRENFGNPHSSEHIVGWRANSHVENSKKVISQVMECEPDEILFNCGATEGNNHSMYALSALSNRFPDRKRVIISEIEHKCILESSKYWATHFGLELCLLKVDCSGQIDFGHLVELLETPTLFCSIMYVNNEIGVIQDLEKIADLLKEKEIFFHSDCAQALKARDLNGITELVDIATFSGHKIGGPQGIGCSFISYEIQEIIEPQILGGGQQQGLRSGTLALPLVVGLGEAFRYFLDQNETNKRRAVLFEKRDLFWKTLQKLNSDLYLNGPDFTLRHPGNLNVCFPGVRASDLLMSLQPDICVSSGSACSSNSIEPSYVLLALGCSSECATSSVRISLSDETDISDLRRAVNIIIKKYENLLDDH